MATTMFKDIQQLRGDYIEKFGQFPRFAPWIPMAEAHRVLTEALKQDKPTLPTLIPREKGQPIAD